jgi:hypothetical protein
MLTKYIGLISQTRKVPMAQVLQIAAAIQKQLTRDFQPLWNIPATIQAFQSLEDMPTDYWPILIMDDINFPGAAGIHLDRNGQPYSLVQAEGVISLTVSHEALEMIADPFGDRFVAGESLKAGQGRVNYLVEVCDPSEDESFAYQVNGIVVSDFYTPHYMDPLAAPGVRYSFSGAISGPREVLKGGYLSWMLPETGEWWQANQFGETLEINPVGKLEKNGRSWREVIDSMTQPRSVQGREGSKNAGALQITGNALFAAASSAHAAAKQGKAGQLKSDIAGILKSVNPGYLKNLENARFLEGPQAAVTGYNPLQVIRFALDIAGRFSLPETTPNIRAFSLSTNLQYDDTTFFSLFVELTNYIGDIDSSKTLDEEALNGCSTVGDIVDLVETTLA